MNIVGQSDNYYRSAATSPLHTPSLSVHSSEGVAPLHYEDYGESDDELRREDILFPNEGGNVNSVASRYIPSSVLFCFFGNFSRKRFRLV